MDEVTDWLKTLSPVQLRKLYDVSGLPKGEINNDYVAGYWAMWACWSCPSSHAQAAEGWNAAVGDFDEVEYE